MGQRHRLIAVMRHKNGAGKVRSHPGIAGQNFLGFYVGGNGKQEPCWMVLEGGRHVGTGLASLRLFSACTIAMDQQSCDIRLPVEVAKPRQGHKHSANTRVKGQRIRARLHHI